MSFLRRLQDLLNPPTWTRADAIDPTPSTVPAVAGGNWIPVDTGQWQPIFTALAFHAEHPGTPHHTDPGFPTTATTPEGLST